MPRDLHPDVAPLVQPMEPRTGTPHGERPGNSFVTDAPSQPKPHPAVADVLRFFEYGHLPPVLQEFSRPISELAHQMAATLEGPQLTLGLHKLLEAKDCFVRAALPPR